MVHHDLWDYDVPSQPMLLELPVEGRLVPAVVQFTKMGHVFVLYRETGAPLFPVEERAVPASDVPGERASPTQPFPTQLPSLHPPRLDPEDAWGLTPWDRGRCRERIAAARSEGIFTPPSLAGTIAFPGNLGGNNWGGGAFDAARNRLVVNSMRLPVLVRLIPRDDFDQAALEGQLGAIGDAGAQLGTPFGVSREVVLSPFGLPCNPPPWGVLTALDLSTGAIRWEVPLGTTRGVAPWPLWFKWGTPNMGGPLATAGGVVFISATTDQYLRAFDVDTGEEIWKAHLPAGGHSSPVTYRARENGRQFVVIAAGGHRDLPSDRGDYLVAFALAD